MLQPSPRKNRALALARRDVRESRTVLNGLLREVTGMVRQAGEGTAKSADAHSLAAALGHALASLTHAVDHVNAIESGRYTEGW